MICVRSCPNGIQLDPFVCLRFLLLLCPFFSLIFSSVFFLFFSFIFRFFFFCLFVRIEQTVPGGSIHRNKIKKSSSQLKKSVTNLYGRPHQRHPTTTTTVANVNGGTHLQANDRNDFKSHPRIEWHERHNSNTTTTVNMDFLISRMPTATAATSTANAVRPEKELQSNGGVLLVNGINNNNNNNNILNAKQRQYQLEQEQQQKLLHRRQQQHLQHQVQQKMTKKKLKLAQTQLDKLTQINIHLHGMY